MSISSIEGKILKCDGEITDLIKNIDDTMKKLMSDTSKTNIVTDFSGKVLNSNTFIKLNYSGSVYNVLNTPNISVSDLVSFIKNNGLSQDKLPQKYNDACLGIAKAYGRALMVGKLQRDMDSFYGGAYTYFNGGTTTSSDKGEILKIVYNQLYHGKPCVLMVTTKRGSRHFATVVGMKETVTSASELKEEDLLIIDSYDGKLEAMDNSVTADRHMHKEHDGKYRVDVLTTI